MWFSTNLTWKWTLNSPIDRRDGWHVVLRANAFGEQSIPDLPREHRRIVPLVISDRLDNRRRRHLRLRATYHASLEAAGFVIPVNKKRNQLDGSMSRFCYILYVYDIATLQTIYHIQKSLWTNRKFDPWCISRNYRRDVRLQFVQDLRE